MRLCVKNSIHTHIGQTEVVEVPRVSVGDEGPASPWGSHSSDKLHIDHVAEDIVPAVPAVIVHELPEELNGRLQGKDGATKRVKGDHCQIGGWSTSITNGVLQVRS